MQSFAIKYNGRPGIDVREGQGLRKAWRELGSSSEEWLKPRKKGVKPAWCAAMSAWAGTLRGQ